jgi:hypothetical protein
VAVQARREAETSRPRGSGLRRAAGLVANHPWLLTILGCAVLLVLPPMGGDLPAQQFYGWLARHHPTELWNNNWYDGHVLSGYSLLFPPLAAVLGARLVGALAAVAAAWVGNTLFREAGVGIGDTGRRAAQLGSAWFAVGCLGPFVVGQMPFGVGTALALAALLGVLRKRPWWAGLAALAASLSSPLVGAFLLMVGLAWATDIGLRRAAPLGAAVAGLLMAVVFGGGGWFPFPGSALVSVLVFCGLGLVLVPHPSRTLRTALLLYGVSAIVIYAVQNPVGGNIARLGALVGGPLAAMVLASRRRWWTLGLLAVPLLAWQFWPLGTAVSRSFGDESSRPSYYAGLTAFLRSQDPARGRLEVPTLRQHWEAYYVAREFPIARGWERQLDLRDNEVLYQSDLTADRLHQWLVGSGVGLVALPDAPLDHWSGREGELIAAGQPWLTPVWSDGHWRVWRVNDSPGLATGSARMTALGLDSFSLQADEPGSTVVRIHWTPFWSVMSGQACLQKGPGGWTTVRVTSPGRVDVKASWDLSAAIRPGSGGGRCR